MQKNLDVLPEIKLVGIKVRTNNANEMNPEVAKIGSTIQKYSSNEVQEKIKNLENNIIHPERTLAVYTEYESDKNGNYTYFIGKEVDEFIENDGLEHLTIPSQNYVKFTSDPGAMPKVCIDMWMNIWSMSDVELMGKRSYIADFEVYDERAYDVNNTVLDIFIGIKNN